MADTLINDAILEITEAVQTLARTTPSSSLTNPALARLRRRRNRLIAMLMFSISGVAASCMPEFSRLANESKDPWTTESENGDDGDADGHEQDGIDGLGSPTPVPAMFGIAMGDISHGLASVAHGAGAVAPDAEHGNGNGSLNGASHNPPPPVVAGINDDDNDSDGGGGGVGGPSSLDLPPFPTLSPVGLPAALHIPPVPDHSITDPALGPHPFSIPHEPADFAPPPYDPLTLWPAYGDDLTEVPGDDGDWFGDAIFPGGNMQHTLSSVLLGSPRSSGGLPPMSLEVKLADGTVIKLKSHTREVRRLVAVFRHAWQTVLEDLDIAKAEKWLAERRARVRSRSKSMDEKAETRQERSRLGLRLSPEPRAKEKPKEEKQGQRGDDDDDDGGMPSDHLTDDDGPGLHAPLYGLGPLGLLARPPVTSANPFARPPPLPPHRYDPSAPRPRKARTADSFDPFHTERPDAVAKEAVRKINRIGKRIVRRVQLDQTLLQAKSKNGKGHRRSTEDTWIDYKLS